MLLLINNKELMGDFVNNRFLNIVTWLTVVLIIALTLLMVAFSLSNPGQLI